MAPAVSEAEIRTQARADGIIHFATGVAVERDGKVLVVRRAPNDTRPGAYELPGGGVDLGETITHGAVRELQEETGLTVTKVLGTFPGFDYMKSTSESARQINFLVEAAGDVQLSHEHDHYLWIAPSDIKSLVTSDEMKECFVRAFAAFRECQLGAVK